MTERYGLILFPETREAMTAEKEGRAHGLSVRIVPTPGKLVASCGFSLRLVPRQPSGAPHGLREMEMKVKNFSYGSSCYGIDGYIVTK